MSDTQEMINSVLQQASKEKNQYSGQPESHGKHFHFAMELADTMNRLPSNEAWILKARISAVVAEFVSGQTSTPSVTTAPAISTSTSSTPTPSTSATSILHDSIHYWLTSSNLFPIINIVNNFHQLYKLQIM